MKFAPTHGRVRYATFEVDPETHINEAEVAQGALEKLRPRYSRHPKQRGITTRLGEEISRGQAVTRPIMIPTTLRRVMLPLTPDYATVLGNALQLYVAETLTDTRGPDVSPAMREVRLLETIAAKSMVEVLGQEFPIRPFPNA
jgi:hypothetical protein